MKQYNTHIYFFWGVLLSFFSIIPLTLVAQIVDSTLIQIIPAADIETLVFEEFIKKGNCVQIENIQPIGNIKSIGSFENGKEAIGIPEGIVFSTGDLIDIPGPNFTTGTTGGQYGESIGRYSRTLWNRCDVGLLAK